MSSVLGGPLASDSHTKKSRCKRHDKRGITPHACIPRLGSTSSTPRGPFYYQANAGFVFPPPRGEFHCPEIPPVFGRITGDHAAKRRPRTMDQQGSSIAISSFSQKPDFAAGGVLTRHKPQECSKFPAVFEVRGHAGDSQQNRGGHNADTWHLHQVGKLHSLYHDLEQFVFVVYPIIKKAQGFIKRSQVRRIRPESSFFSSVISAGS